MKTTIRLSAAALLLVATACASRGKAVPAGAEAKPAPPSGTPVGQSVTLEAEDFKLIAVTAKEHPGASGGRAIRFMDFAGEATKTVHLSKGTYEVALHSQGPDTHHDAVFFTVAGTEFRFYQDDWDKVAAAKVRDVDPVLCDVAEDGEHRLVISFAEEDVWVDKVVLKRVK